MSSSLRPSPAYFGDGSNENISPSSAPTSLPSPDIAVTVPLDEALAQVTVDIGGRGYAVVETGLENRTLGDLGGDLVGHFLERLALEGGMNLHCRVLADGDPHHVAEALFKALARALRIAVELDPRAAGEVPSTKGTISK